MSTQLDLAVTQLEKAVEAQGTAKQPEPGSSGFFVIRANALGLSFLRQCARDGIADFAAFNEQYKLALRSLKVEE